MLGAHRRRRREVSSALDVLIPLVPTPWSAEAFIDRVAQNRGRPINLISYSLTSDDPTGYWLSYPDRDVIVVPDSAAGSRRDAIIAHELAHMMLGHLPMQAAGVDDPSALTANMSPDLVARFLPRHGYQPIIEKEAESLSTLLMAHIYARPTVETRTERGRISDGLR